MAFGGCGEGRDCADAVGRLLAAVGNSALDLAEVLWGFWGGRRVQFVVVGIDFGCSRSGTLGGGYRRDGFSIRIVVSVHRATLLVSSHGAVKEEIFVIERVFTFLVRDGGCWKVVLSIFVNAFDLEIGKVLRGVAWC